MQSGGENRRAGSFHLHRRGVMAGAGVLALGSSMKASSLLAKTGETAVADDYFLSPENPIATRDQRDLDALAIELFARDDVQRATSAARRAFEIVTDHSASSDVMALLSSYAESFAFRSIQLAVNSDANFPRVYRIYAPAAKWLGNDVPESRWGQENPDNLYRIIPIAPGGRYLLRGQRQANPPSDVSYVLVADTNTSITLGLLGQNDLDVAPDGSFSITLDEKPAIGRRNHIQIRNEARYLFIRDTLGDWRQTPNRLSIERLNPPSRGPLTNDERAEQAERVMQLGVAPAYYWNRLVVNGPANTMTQPHGTGPSGGLLTQQSSHGWFKLEAGQCAVIRFTPIEANYQSIVLYDMWGRSLEYRDHLTSMNGAQMAPDTDGSFSFVLSQGDPGIHNWLDTMGLREFCVGIRWQGIRSSTKSPPSVTAQILDLPDLAKELRTGIRKTAPDQRARQFAQRQTAYDRRLRGD